MMRLSLICLALCWAAVSNLHAQTLNDIDTTHGFGREVFKLYQRYDAIRFSGYIQPQFQVASAEGAHGFSGGDFSPHSDNRFTLRRGRIRLDYAQFNAEHLPVVYFVFQFDGSERGVFIRDFWGRFLENKFQLFAFTTGMFARPFGQELLLSSAERESPERGRMSQTLMRVERDLGAMATFEPRRPGHPLHWLKADLGIFNGQGLNAPTDFDSHKDVVARLSAKLAGQPKWRLGIGIQGLFGGIRQPGPVVQRWESDHFVAESDGEGQILPRRYLGADAQLKIANRHGWTELRAEFITGRQTATEMSSETPAVFALNAQGQFAPLYVRPFGGAYFYWLQNLGSLRHQLVVKYDWYDPNTGVSGQAVDPELTVGDIKFSTLGFGYVYYATEHLKITLWYDLVRNEQTRIPNFLSDVPDNVFTARMQFRF